MASYRIEIVQSVLKTLLKLPKKDNQRIIDTISRLSTEPFPPQCKKLRGEQNSFRIRVGNYRIIYEIFHERLVITVLKIGHRKDIYR